MATIIRKYLINLESQRMAQLCSALGWDWNTQGRPGDIALSHARKTGQKDKTTPSEFWKYSIYMEVELEKSPLSPRKQAKSVSCFATVSYLNKKHIPRVCRGHLPSTKPMPCISMSPRFTLFRLHKNPEPIYHHKNVPWTRETFAEANSDCSVGILSL